MDAINAGFEIVGSVLILLNVRQILKDKVVKGISLIPVTHWTAWGMWNIFYYPSLGQTYSFYAGIMVVLANAWWLALAFKYRNNK